MKKQAGADGFVNSGYGANANRVFAELVQEARYEYGSGGYTGTIAEKGGFTMATREVMSKKKAQEYADEHYDDYGKWDDAGCVAFGEEKVVAEKEFEVKVKARNKEEAKKMVQEKMMGGKKRAGAVIEVEIPWNGGVVLTTPAGKRKITTDKPNGEVFYIRSSNTNKKYSTKKEAVASTKELLESPNNIDPGQVVRILKVQDQGGMSYAESSKLATYTVSGKRIQKKVGKVEGYYFFGMASS